MITFFAAPLRTRIAAMSVCAGLVLSGCAGTPAYDSALSPAENQLRQSNARFSQTVGEGAVTGALVGAAAGALLSRNRAQGALIGAGVGTAVGAGAGYLVARNNASRNHTEADYRNAISEAQAEADGARNAAVAANDIAANARSQLASLNAQVRSGQATAAAYNGQIQRYQQDNDLINQQISHNREVATALRQDAASSPNRAQLLMSARDVDQSNVSLQRSQRDIAAALAARPAGRDARAPRDARPAAVCDRVLPAACDPSQAGFFSGIGCEASGVLQIAQRIAAGSARDRPHGALQNDAAAYNARNDAASAQLSLAERRRRLGALDSQVAAARRQLANLRQSQGVDQDRLARAQQAVDQAQSTRAQCRPRRTAHRSTPRSAG